MAASSSSVGSDLGTQKGFCGDKEDVMEYHRFKTWCSNKMMTMDKLPKTARGAFVMTLLSGKALECVEHLDMSEYQCQDGEKVIWKVFDARFIQIP